jgi:hypothetical protein
MMSFVHHFLQSTRTSARKRKGGELDAEPEAKLLKQQSDSTVETLAQSEQLRVLEEGVFTYVATLLELARSSKEVDLPASRSRSRLTANLHTLCKVATLCTNINTFCFGLHFWMHAFA